MANVHTIHVVGDNSMVADPTTNSRKRVLSYIREASGVLATCVLLQMYPHVLGNGSGTKVERWSVRARLVIFEDVR